MKSTPCMILGMHRSGTSMITRILSENNLWIGNSNNLMPPQPDNPDGFFEYLPITQINDSLLEHLGGGWDKVPNFPTEWINSNWVKDLQEKAIGAINELKNSLPATCVAWGWKDPRTSILLPFWTSIIPDAKLLICLRDPIAVAQSLSKRNGSSINFGLSLWYDYYKTLCDSLTENQFLVTHYDTWFIDAQRELNRIVSWLSLETDSNLENPPSSIINKSYRHHITSEYEKLLTSADYSLVKYYNNIRKNAGNIYLASLSENEKQIIDNLSQEPHEALNSKLQEYQIDTQNKCIE